MYEQAFTMNLARNRHPKDHRNFIYLSNRTRNIECVEELCISTTIWAHRSSLQVEQAVREIKRLLIEASAAALQAEMRNPSVVAGRYSVV